MEYWLHFLSEIRGLSGTVIHAEHCRHRRATRLSRRKPAARDGTWVGPFSENVTEHRFLDRSGYRPCPSCCPQAWLPNKLSKGGKGKGRRRTLSTVAQRRNAARAIRSGMSAPLAR
jgi:hypothetical protein